MAIERWKLTYTIQKVNGHPYIKDPDLIREHRENIPGVLQKSAEYLADKYDFATVQCVGRSMDTGEEFRFKFESDDGLRQDWVTGRQ